MSKNTNFIPGKYHVTVDYFNQIRYELLSVVWHFKTRCTHKGHGVQHKALTSIVPKISENTVTFQNKMYSNGDISTFCTN